MTKEFYTEKELADRWGLKVVTLQTWRQKGLPPNFTRFGTAVRYSKDAVEKLEHENVCRFTKDG